MKHLLLRTLPYCCGIALSTDACSSSVGVAVDGTSDAGGTTAVHDAGFMTDGAPSTGIDARDAERDASPGDTGAAADGGACVDFGHPVFDSSCASDAECVSVYAGTLCPGYNCVCAAGRSIIAREVPRYEALASSVPRGTGPFCSCPALGRSRCVAGQCVWCSNFSSSVGNPPGCGDGG